MSTSIHEAGLHLLRHPVRPLLSIVEFIYHTGAFSSVEEVLELLPENIETESALYTKAKEHLRPYLRVLQGCNARKTAEQEQLPQVLDDNNQVLGSAATLSALLAQQILELELERINSLLCGAHHCTLCCTGPDASMRQEYFDIPLQTGEENLFAGVKQRDGEDEGAQLQPLDILADQLHEGGCEAVLIKHQQGLSLVLHRGSHCPALDPEGRCTIYADRPRVCRKPQIFPYLLEEEKDSTGGGPVFRLRNTLLAVMDCPYVQQLQEDIAQYAAASELELVFRTNKA